MFRKIPFLLLALLILLLIFSVISFAHPGDTDSNGGHYDHSTGKYHYHHGYPAHSHIGGCPYDYDDKTGWQSGESAQSDSYSNDSPKTDNTNNNWSFESTVGIIMLIVIGLFVFKTWVEKL